MVPLPVDGMTDGFGRRVSYLRVSVTDRCDFRGHSSRVVES